MRIINKILTLIPVYCLQAIFAATSVCLILFLFQTRVNLRFFLYLYDVSYNYDQWNYSSYGGRGSTGQYCVRTYYLQLSTLLSLCFQLLLFSVFCCQPLDKGDGPATPVHASFSMLGWSPTVFASGGGRMNMFYCLACSPGRWLISCNYGKVWTSQSLPCLLYYLRNLPISTSTSNL